MTQKIDNVSVSHNIVQDAFIISSGWFEGANPAKIFVEFEEMAFDEIVSDNFGEYFGLSGFIVVNGCEGGKRLKFEMIHQGLVSGLIC